MSPRFFLFKKKKVFEEEIKMLEGIAVEINNAFSIDELTRLYADFKMNGESISEADFGIIFATFSRTVSLSCSVILSRAQSCSVVLGRA